MERTEYIQKESTFFQRLQKQISLLLVVLVGTTLVVNLGLLSFLGTKGGELASVRKDQEEQKLRNDLLRAELEELKVSSKVESRAKEELNMKQASVKVINVIPKDTVSAQSN